jgi:hypothetical protein
VIVLAATLVGATGTAHALSCGQTITSNTTLTADLVGCPGSGLVVRTSGVTIDLNGYTVGGSNATDSIGIDVQSAQNVTVRNGHVRNFATGVHLASAQNTSLVGLDVQHGFTGISIEIASALVDASSMTHNSSGIVISGAVAHVQRSNISDNSFVGVAATPGDTGTVIERNMIARNGNATGFAGVWVQSDGVRLSRNMLLGNSVGVIAGLFFNDSPSHVVISGNMFSSNVRDGLAARGFTSTDIQVTGNYATANGGNGLTVVSGATVTSNWVVSNGQLGINAAEGTIDGGGNHGHGNGDPRQCLNVVCSP